MKVKKGHVTGGKPANFTNRPSFTPTGRAVLFTPLREDKQAGTYRYSLKTCQTERLTKTTASEAASRASAAGGKTFSTVRVEADQIHKSGNPGTEP